VTDKILEAVSEQCHKQWSGWTEHFLSKTKECCSEHISMDVTWIDRWRKQIATPYADLTEEEKESDRREARKILEAIGNGSDCNCPGDACAKVRGRLHIAIRDMQNATLDANWQRKRAETAEEWIRGEPERDKAKYGQMKAHIESLIKHNADMLAAWTAERNPPPGGMV
jgi:hypothetical protein